MFWKTNETCGAFATQVLAESETFHVHQKLLIKSPVPKGVRKVQSLELSEVCQPRSPWSQVAATWIEGS